MENKKPCSCMNRMRSKRENNRRIQALNQQKKLQALNQQRNMKKKYESDLQKAIKQSIEEKKLNDIEQQNIKKAIEESLEEKKLNDIINNIDDNNNTNDIDNYLQNMIDNLSITEKKVITSRNGDDMYDYKKNIKKTNTYNENENNNKTKNETKKHINIIVGRGPKELKGGLNIPLSPIFTNGNNVFIDALPEVNPDIAKPLSEVDFTQFGITKDQDPENKTDVRIYFDWSSAYCGGLHSIHKIAQQLRRPFEIYVTLSNTENKVPSDVKNILWYRCYDFILEDGHYPLFDWTVPVLKSSGKPISDYVNPNHYLKILFRIRKRN